MAGCDLGKAEALDHPSAPGRILSGLFAEEGGPLSMGICWAFEDMVGGKRRSLGPGTVLGCPCLCECVYMSVCIVILCE